MVGEEELLALELIAARMSGFVLFNPILGRGNIPGYWKAGLILVLTLFVYGLGYPEGISLPGTLLELAVKLLLELALIGPCSPAGTPTPRRKRSCLARVTGH